MKNQLSKKEVMINLLILLLILLLISKMFYGTFLGAVILLPLLIPLYKRRKKQILEKKKQSLEKRFKDMLVSVSDALKTGYSIENALAESYKDMKSMYGEKSDICMEIKNMISKIRLNVPVEKVFREFAMKSELKNAMLFSEAFSVAKKTGGNMVEVIKNVTDDIVLKNSVKEEIDVIIFAKRMEHRIMMIIPAFLIGYIGISSNGFLDVMYETMLGRIIMTGCIGAYLAAYLWGEKITEMEV